MTDTGCEDVLNRYFWSNESQDCINGIYDGCLASHNNFENYDECINVAGNVCQNLAGNKELAAIYL